MPINRYAFVRPINNSNESYDDFFKSKKVKSIEHLTIKKYKDINKVFDSFSVSSHICKSSDKLTTLSSLYYGDPRYWYIIALCNKIPNDFFLEDGKEIYIFFPLERVVSFFNGT